MARKQKAGGIVTFQLGSALLEACVLAVLARGDAYGYVLTQQVGAVIEVSETALYPVLRRLQKDGALATYDQPYQGRNRRYYQVTQQGRDRLREFRAEWLDYKKAIDSILLEEGQKDDQG